jgi:hypothetical protein
LWRISSFLSFSSLKCSTFFSFSFTAVSKRE